MAITSSSIQAGFEPIPGYILRNKLGAGGYGEVWLADAPGGLKKAIKFVHGSIDGNKASGELRSLQRVRQVNHPFILSLERIEVVDGQLMIVTELAQGSLHDRFVEFQEKGFVGIMRERLLGYLRDTADGLDFLCQQHDLQHLDVKPANLLLVADRVKIADFGLIKDIQSNSLSVMGGLTPTYAAPEMFDGRPGRYSDQYSLAIVYQELLTGTFPFRGRTTAQLANEHLNKAPNLEAIPLIERPILAKALAKRPQMRFSDCREFIAALERVHSQAAQPAAVEGSEILQAKKRPSKVQQRTGAKNAGVLASKDPSSIVSTQSQIAPAQNARGIEVLPMLAEMDDVSDATRNASSEQDTKKCFVIGLGATGAQALLAMRNQIIEINPQQIECEQFGFLAIDSDQKTIEKVLDLDRKERLPYHASLLIPLKSPQYYRSNTKSDFRQLSRRWLYNIPRSLKTEGVRPLGMLAFLDNATRVYQSLKDSILEIAKSNGDAAFAEPIEVQIVSSAHGGTGGTIAPEIGFMVRQIAAEFEIPMHIEMVLTCASPNSFVASDLTTASALACLTEINHYFQTEGLHPKIDQISESTAINQPPFDRLSLVYGGQCGNAHDWEEAVKQAAQYMWACNCSDLGTRIALTRLELDTNDRRAAEHGWTTWLSTVSTRTLEIASNSTPDEAAKRICLQKSLQWLATFDDPRLSDRGGTIQKEPTDPKLLEKMDFFVGDMFRNNHWTAQAWVRECMTCLVATDSESQAENEGTSKASEARKTGETGKTNETVKQDSGKETKLDSVLNREQRKELEQVCEQLAVNVDNATHTISSMLTDTQQKLGEWLIHRWFAGPTEMLHLREMVRLIGAKFTVNANSLQVVSQKLCDNHDACLERLYSGEQKTTPEQDQQLQTMALEARFHSLGAKMLLRLAEHMDHLEDLWLNECEMIRRELCDWIGDLSKQLGIPFDNTAKSNTILPALLQAECDDATNKEVRKWFQAVIGSRLASTLDGGVAPANAGDGTLMAFVDILGLSTRLLTKPTSPSSKLIDLQESNSGPASVIDASKTILVGDLTQSVGVNSETFFQDNLDSGQLVRRSLEIEIDSSRPHFVEFGGAVRNVALIPTTISHEIDPFQRATLDDRKVATICGDQFREPILICLGEQLVLSDILDRVWMPSADIWHLAHRILSRVDVDWVPIQVQ